MMLDRTRPTRTPSRGTAIFLIWALALATAGGPAIADGTEPSPPPPAASDAGDDCPLVGRWNLTEANLRLQSDAAEGGAAVSVALQSRLAIHGWEADEPEHRGFVGSWRVTESLVYGHFRVAPDHAVSGEGKVKYHVRITGGSRAPIPLPNLPIGAVASLDELGVRDFTIRGAADPESCTIALEAFEAQGDPLRLRITPGGRSEFALWPPMTNVRTEVNTLEGRLSFTARGVVGAFEAELEGEMDACDRLWYAFERKDALGAELLEESSEYWEEIEHEAEEEYWHWATGIGIAAGQHAGFEVILHAGEASAEKAAKGVFDKLAVGGAAAAAGLGLAIAAAGELILKMVEGVQLVHQINRATRRADEMSEAGLELKVEAVDHRLERQELGCGRPPKPEPADAPGEAKRRLERLIEEIRNHPEESPEGDMRDAFEAIRNATELLVQPTKAALDPHPSRAFALAAGPQPVETRPASTGPGPDLEAARTEIARGVAAFGRGLDKLRRLYRHQRRIQDEIRDLLDGGPRPVGP